MKTNLQNIPEHEDAFFVKNNFGKQFHQTQDFQLNDAKEQHHKSHCHASMMGI